VLAQDHPKAGAGFEVNVPISCQFRTGPPSPSASGEGIKGLYPIQQIGLSRRFHGLCQMHHAPRSMHRASRLLHRVGRVLQRVLCHGDNVRCTLHRASSFVHHAGCRLHPVWCTASSGRCAMVRAPDDLFPPRLSLYTADPAPWESTVIGSFFQLETITDRHDPGALTALLSDRSEQPATA